MTNRQWRTPPPLSPRRCGVHERTSWSSLEELQAGGYRFEDTEGRPPFEPPAPDIVRQLDDLERRIGPLPMALRGWDELVARQSVVLWDASGYSPSVSPLTKDSSPGSASFVDRTGRPDLLTIRHGMNLRGDRCGAPRRERRVRETRVIAVAFQFTAAGVVALVIGWWTSAKADQLTDAKTRFCRRFIPGLLGPLAARIIDAAGYRLAGLSDGLRRVDDVRVFTGMGLFGPRSMSAGMTVALRGRCLQGCAHRV